MAVAGAPRSTMLRAMGSQVVRGNLRQQPVAPNRSSSRSKIDRRIARVLSAMGAAMSHFSPNSPKLLASIRRRFSRCFSIAGDRPSPMARLASMHFSRARASDKPVGAVFPEIDGLPTAVQTVVQPKQIVATGHNVHIHAVTVRDFVDFLLWFQCLSAASVSTSSSWKIPSANFERFDGRKFLLFSDT